jgi:hypothetical protein
MMTDATPATNRERIVRVEDEVSALDERVTRLEAMHIEHMAKMDMMMQLAKVILALVGAGLGLDLGIQGGMI